MPAPFHLHLEIPVATPAHAFFAVKGWVASDTPALALYAGRPADGHTLGLVERPDVRAALPAYRHAVGFFGRARSNDIVDGKLHLTIVTADGEHPLSWPLPPPPFPGSGAPPDFAISPELKKTKFQKLSGRLACPACRRPLAGLTPRCTGCEARFEFSPTSLDFLSPAERATVPAVGATGDSLGGYDEVMHALVNLLPAGLILDCGAGLKQRIYPNVINLEIMAYPSTDVRAFNERLPFVDGSFDAVFTLATLEHVKDPFAAAREIMRVLKPGGILYSMVPLLIPFHGYPNHYYNMTIEGHKNVFGPELELLEASVPLSGHPIWALSALLKAWHEGLAPAAREEFLDLRVRDLLDQPMAYVQRDFVRHLSPTAAMDIAAVTCLLARKRA